MNDTSAVTPIRPLRTQEDTLSADFTLTTATSSHGMGQVELLSRGTSQGEPPLVRELRQVIAELQGKTAAQEREIKELRGAIVALMEPDTPRILRTAGSIIVLDKK